MGTFLANWKSILGSIAAALVVILQVIQILIGSHIEGVLDQKADQIRAKTDAINTLLASNGEVSRGNRELLTALHDEIHKIEAELEKK